MEHFIKNIEITNFKSIRHAEVKDCRRVNVFVGYPNVGKSNILEALSLFSLDNLSESNDFALSDIVRIREFSQFFLFGNVRKPASIILNKRLYLQAQYESGKMIVKAGGPDGSSQEVLTVNQMMASSVYPIFDAFISDLSSNILSRNSLSKNSLRQRFPVKKYLYRSELKSFDNITQQTTLKFPYGQNLADIVFLYAEVKSFLQELLRRDKLKLALDVSTSKLKILKELEDESIFLNDFDLMADSLRRLVFYNSAIASNKKISLLFEEPEAHMFPPYISQLTSDIIQDKNQNQFFIATHSPFVLNDFMEDLKDDELSIYAVGLQNGETTVNRMTDEQVTEAYQYGIDLFFNLEEYLTPGKITNNA